MPRGTRSGMCDRGSSGGSVVQGARPCTSTSRMCRMRDRARFVGWRGRDPEAFFLCKADRRVGECSVAPYPRILTGFHKRSRRHQSRGGQAAIRSGRTRLVLWRNRAMDRQRRRAGTQTVSALRALSDWTQGKRALGHFVARRYQEFFESPLACQESCSKALRPRRTRRRTPSLAYQRRPPGFAGVAARV